MDSKYVKNYYRIMHKIISRSFPSLKDEKIEIVEAKVKWRGRAEFWPWKKRITVSTKVRRYRREKVVGLFAHELCHFEMDKNKGFIWSTAVQLIVCRYFKKANFRIEWNTDMMAIQKGYGKYLLYSKKNQTARQKAGYMPREYVRKVMKEHKVINI